MKILLLLPKRSKCTFFSIFIVFVSFTVSDILIYLMSTIANAFGRFEILFRVCFFILFFDFFICFVHFHSMLKWSSMCLWSLYSLINIHWSPCGCILSHREWELFNIKWIGSMNSTHQDISPHMEQCWINPQLSAHIHTQKKRKCPTYTILLHLKPISSFDSVNHGRESSKLSLSFFHFILNGFSLFLYRFLSAFITIIVIFRC